MFPFEAELSVVFWGSFLWIWIDKYVHAVVAAVLWTPLVGRKDWKAKAWFLVLSVLFISKELRDLYLKGTFFSSLDVVAGYAGIVLAETVNAGFRKFRIKKTGVG